MHIKTWMPLYVGDYLRDTTHLRAAESGAYLHLIMHYWLHGGLPDDDRQLATIAKMTDSEWKESRSVLEQFFQPGWRHDRIDKEIEKAKHKYERRSAAARSRWNNRDKYQNEGTNARDDSNAHAMHDALHEHAGVIVDVDLPVYKNDESEEENSTVSRRTGVTRARNPVDQPKTPEKPAKNPHPEDWPDDFEAQFWAAYPNKVGKPKAIEKIRLIARSGRVSWAVLMDGLRRYVSGKPPDRQWCNPLTWLNQERWADEPAVLVFARPPRVQPTDRLGFDETSPYDELGRPLGAAGYARKLAKAAGYLDG